MKREKIKDKPQSKAPFWRWATLVLSAILLLSAFTPRGARLWNSLLWKAGLAHFTAELDPENVHIHVIDVGKADAILIESADAAILVDTGTADTAKDVLQYLEQRQITKLDAVWLSHRDSDHAGGLQSILDCVEVEETVGSVHCELPLKTQSVTPGDVVRYGELTFTVLAPVHTFENENDNSLVFLMEYGAFSMLFCGDIEEKAEAALLESGASLQADVLKVAHHGSDTSTSNAWLGAVTPTYAVISTGEDKSHLPRNTVLRRLRDADVSYYRTDRDGTVVFSTDGVEIEILTETAEGFSADERSKTQNEKNDY